MGIAVCSGDTAGNPPQKPGVWAYALEVNARRVQSSSVLQRECFRQAQDQRDNESCAYCRNGVNSAIPKEGSRERQRRGWRHHSRGIQVSGQVLGKIGKSWSVNYRPGLSEASKKNQNLHLSHLNPGFHLPLANPGAARTGENSYLGGSLLFWGVLGLC